ncbi:uncharacterized protein FFNC_15629 [Fusarium fujikuroi]|nr:uncharacterized protein FFNC_15629 [Fusarium fujikuroi]
MKSAPRIQPRTYDLRPLRSTPKASGRPIEGSYEGTSDGKGGPALFEVEHILEHEKREHGKIWFLVKWRGYSQKENSWEPEMNFKDSGEDILGEYYDKLNTLEESRRVAETKKRTQTVGSTFVTAGKRCKTEGSTQCITDATWPTAVEKWSCLSEWCKVKTINGCDKNIAGCLIFHVTWNNGDQTKHDKETIYERCPQKMLEYYEKQAKISIKEEEPIGDSPKTWVPHSVSWEKDIERIDRLHKDDAGRLKFCIIWNNGEQTEHDKEILYEKCTQMVAHPLLKTLASQHSC